MGRREQIGWVAALLCSTSAVAYLGGLGVRGLVERLHVPSSAISASEGLTQVASVDPRVPSDPDLQTPTLFYDVLRKLRIYYVDPLPPKTELARGALRAMLASLQDPDTRLLSPEEMEAYRQAAAGNYRGLGAVLAVRQGPAREEAAGADADDGAPRTGPRTITVVAVMPGSPAETAGLRSGDRLTELDGQWIAPVHLSYRVRTQLAEPIGRQDLTPPDPEAPRPRVPPASDSQRRAEDAAAKRWRTALDVASVLPELVAKERGARVITVDRPGSREPLRVSVTYRPTRVELVTSRVESPKPGAKIGYVRILGFSAETPGRFGETLRALAAEGVAGLVLDLRQCPGGSLEAARDAAGVLIPNGRFAILRDRTPSGTRADRGVGITGVQPRLKGIPIRILVDRGTAGAAESFAAALRDRRGARLVGAATNGDGRLQEVHPLDDGSGFSITHAEVLTVSGASFAGKGLTPHERVDGDALPGALAALASAVQGASP